MVLKNTSVLSCLLSSRFGFGSSHRPDSRVQEKELVAHDHRHLGNPDTDPFRGNHPPSWRPSVPVIHADFPDTPRARANTVPSDSVHLSPTGDIGESPVPVHRPFASPVRAKRSSLTTFFAFSSKRKHAHVHRDLLAPPQPVPGRWLRDSRQAEVHLISSSTIPSPLRTDEEEYYLSYYTSLTPTTPTQSTSPRAGALDISPSKSFSLRRQDLIGNPDLDSQLSSPVDSHPSHTRFQHPYAYSSPLSPRSYSKTTDTAPSLRHASSQPFQHRPSDDQPHAHSGAASSQLGHQASKSHPLPSQPQLKASVSTPNLSSAASVRPRSLVKRRPPTGSRGQERWLTAESWWDALFSPSPRFKVKQATRPHAAAGRVVHNLVRAPVEGEPSGTVGVTFPSVPVVRPRAVSATSGFKHTHPSLTRSWSATDLNHPSTSAVPRANFEPALETLADESTPTPDRDPGGPKGLSSPEPPISLEQVIDEGRAFEQQRAQWKRQASRSIGNKHTRSFSRARSKSLGERHIRGHDTSEGGKSHSNLEFLAARSLLGSQSTMPTVHVTKPSISSSHSKAYSHSHSRSTHSYSHTSSSRAYSHSHSHSLATSNSSKSSRNPRRHSRSGSWSRTALLKAGVLCGISQDDSYVITTADEKVPSSSGADLRGAIHLGAPANAEGVSGAPKVSSPLNVPNNEVGIAITSLSPPEGTSDQTMLGHSHASGLRYQHGDLERRSSSKHTHSSSEYAGPHPSAIDSNLPQLAVSSNVSLRHRLPPRAIYPPIAPIAHPYRTALLKPKLIVDTTYEGVTPKEGHASTQSGSERSPYSHISLTQTDFEQYGVGEALVYASAQRSSKIPEAKKPDAGIDSLRATSDLSPTEEQSCSHETVVSHPEGSETPSIVMNNPPSLTNSTIQMVMSAFNNPDDLDEFQDLFYKPNSISGEQRQGSSASINQVPVDVRSSASSSPLIHLVRKLNEEVNSRKNPSRTPSGSVRRQRSEDHPSDENGGTKLVLLDLVRPSSSPSPMEDSSSQLHVTVTGEEETTSPSILVIPEDVDSFYAASVLEESPSAERENDTFGYPIKRGQLEAVTTSSPIQTPLRLSTHLSIQDQPEADERASPRPETRRYELTAADAVVRSSCFTTSDVSRMSGLLDFPLPPNTRPSRESLNSSLLQAYMDATPSEAESRDSYSETEMERAGGDTVDDEDGEPSHDVEEMLHPLRESYNSRTTFGGSDDVDFVTQLHQARS